jgi:hypothetical protein
MTAFELLGALVKAAVWMGAYAQLLGMPVAWLRLRKTPAWENRPGEVRRIDLLAEFILGPTVLTIVWGWLAFVVIALGGLGLSGGVLLVVMWSAPLIFVPWAVLRLDKDRFPQLVEQVRERRERKLARRAQGD